jgi:DNA-binding MarR family transcriptional regulator
MSKDNVVSQHILDYLKQHPQANDTLEGLARWWMLRQQVSNSVTDVKEALDALIEQGLVKKRESPDGRILYSLTERK